MITFFHVCTHVACSMPFRLSKLYLQWGSCMCHVYTLLWTCVTCRNWWITWVCCFRRQQDFWNSQLSSLNRIISHKDCKHIDIMMYCLQNTNLLIHIRNNIDYTYNTYTMMHTAIYSMKPGSYTTNSPKVYLPAFSILAESAHFLSYIAICIAINLWFVLYSIWNVQYFI